MLAVYLQARAAPRHCQQQAPLPGEVACYLEGQTGCLSREGALGKTDTEYIQKERESKNRTVMTSRKYVRIFKKKKKHIQAHTQRKEK